MPQADQVLELICFNFCEECPESEILVLSIREIQGDSDISPYLGQIVETSGEELFASEDACFIQDANEERSGILIYDSSFSTLEIGMGLRLRGTVSEYYGLTEMKDIIWSETYNSTLGIDPIQLHSITITEEYESVLAIALNVEAVESNDFGEWYVKFENNEQILVDNVYTDLGFSVGKKYDLTGIVENRFD